MTDRESDSAARGRGIIGVTGAERQREGDGVSELPDWVPSGVDVSVQNAARVHDYALGGIHNFAVDREAWRNTEAAAPGARDRVHASRAFLGRVVRHLTGLGVRQFLDVGSGLPTLGNVHEAARDADPAARVIYVDNDPVAVVQSRALLDGDPRVRVIEGDLRRPEEILYHPEVLELLDFAEPVAVLLLGLPADGEAVERLGEACVSGSYLVVSGRGDGEGDGPLAALPAEFEIVAPGTVPVTDWHPDPLAAERPQPGLLATVARKA